MIAARIAEWSSSLTAKMVLLVSVAILPILAIQSYNEYDLRKSREDDLRGKVIQITRQFGAEMGGIREGVRQYLQVIGQLPPVAADADRCTALLASLNATVPAYTVLGVAGPDGTVRCVSRATGLSSVADMAFFRRASAQTDLGVGTYWVDPVTGQKQIHFGLKFAADADGGTAGVVFVGLDLNWLSEHLRERGLTPTQSILIADREGNIIARLPNPEKLVGKNMREGHAKILDGNTAGWEEAKGVDGVERIFGYVPPALEPRDFFLSAGESKAAAFATIEDVTHRGILLILLGLLLACGAAVLGGRTLVRRPIQALLQATEEWRNGNYGARIHAKNQRSEIGQLSVAFDDMAEAVSFRYSAQMQAETQLQEFNRSLEKQVEERTRELVAANKAKGQFLANMSHEIRTPMNGMMGMVELLLQTRLDARQRMYVDMAQRSSETMLAMVNTILDLSKIESGKFEIESHKFDLRRILEDTVYMQGPIASRKGLRLDLKLPTNVPTALIGDPMRLGQILNNLVGNAIKFTDRGEVTISATLLEADAKSASIEFEVADTGIGISPENQAIIFNAFTQADDSDTRRFSGSGLGLSICKELCAMMGGAIRVDSQLGAGSTFRFTARFGQHCENIRFTGNEAVARKNYHVLVLGSDDTGRYDLKRQLLQSGMRVEAARDESEAIRLAEMAVAYGDAFGVVLIDMKPPYTGGLELMRMLRADPYHASAAILLLTPPGEIVPEAELYAARQLTKPFSLTDLIARVQEQEMAPPYRMEAERRDDPVAVPGRHALVVEDSATNRMVACDILETLGWSVESAEDGMEALDAHKAGHFDAIFMDCQMPRMDGFEATAEIRKREAAGTRRTPIIALTATAGDRFRDRCLSAGMDAYIAKPFTRQQIEKALMVVV